MQSFLGRTLQMELTSSNVPVGPINEEDKSNEVNERNAVPIQSKKKKQRQKKQCSRERYKQRKIKNVSNTVWFDFQNMIYKKDIKKKNEL